MWNNGTIIAQRIYGIANTWNWDTTGVTPGWNPGAMAFVAGHDASFMYTKLVPDLADDVYFSYLSYVQHTEGWGGRTERSRPRGGTG